MLRVSPPHSAMWLISTMNLGPVPTAVPVYPHDAADINTNTDVHVNTVTRVMLFSNELQYLQYGRAESQNPQSRPEIDFLCSCLVFTNKQTNAFLLVGFLVFRGCVCGCVGVFLSLIQSVLCSVWWRVLVISSSDCCVTQISAHSCFGRSFSYVDIVCYWDCAFKLTLGGFFFLWPDAQRFKVVIGLCKHHENLFIFSSCPAHCWWEDGSRAQDESCCVYIYSDDEAAVSTGSLIDCPPVLHGHWSAVSSLSCLQCLQNPKHKSFLMHSQPQWGYLSK